MPNGEEILVTTANGYITDFISDYYDTGKAPVKSMIMDADLLRSYLSKSDIKNVKFMLGARTITENNQSTEVFTLIVAGYDANGNYVFSSTNPNKVLDHMSPCPNKCPTSGAAANDTIS